MNALNRRWTIIVVLEAFFDTPFGFAIFSICSFIFPVLAAREIFMHIFQLVNDYKNCNLFCEFWGIFLLILFSFITSMKMLDMFLSIAKKSRSKFLFIIVKFFDVLTAFTLVPSVFLTVLLIMFFIGKAPVFIFGSDWIPNYHSDVEVISWNLAIGFIWLLVTLGISDSYIKVRMTLLEEK